MTISTDMVMDTYYVEEKLSELWRVISSQHIIYLEMEETPEKIEQRNKLQDYIKEYLCLAPHKKKFYLPETAQVLHRSASMKKDFSGYRAALGWSAIGIYAANLLAQSWRKEYRTIKTYSGFYKHQIDANLVGAETMFEAMGYRYDRSNSVLILEGPVCPDRLVDVSQDSLIAYVECQILKSIWEEVSKSFKISWLEVLEFRESHLCSPKQSVAALTYRFHEKQYQQHNRSYSQGSDLFTTVGARYPTVPGVLPSTNTLPNNHSFPPVHPHVAPVVSVPSSSQYVYGTNGFFPPNNYATYAPILPTQHYPCNFPVACTQPLMKPYHPNNYCCSNGYSTGMLQDYVSHPVPTAQLVDISSHPNVYDVPDGNYRVNPMQPPPLPLQQTYAENVENNTHINSDKEEVPPGNIDSWDYVYRNLESQGYSKDLGERGDLLTAGLESKKSKPVNRNTSLEEAFNNLGLNKNATKVKDTDRFDVPKREAERKSLNMTGTMRSETTPRKNSISKLSAGMQDTSNKKGENLKSKTLNPKKLKPGTVKEKDDKNLTKSESLVVMNNSNQWECKTCTFLNEKGKEICEMCGKSRNSVEETMEVGGSECPHCTLVNPKNLNYCKACNNSLKNSPTYI